MRLTRRTLGAIAAAGIAATLTPLAPSVALAQQQGTLVIAVPSDPDGLDPGTNRAEPIGSEIILNVFDTLVAWTPPEFAEVEGASPRTGRSRTTAPSLPSICATTSPFTTARRSMPRR